MKKESSNKTFILFAKFLCIFLLAFITFFFSNCTYGVDNIFYEQNNVNNRIENLASINSPDFSTCANEYSVLIITDTHFGAKKGAPPVEEFLDWISKNKESKNIKFCLCLGDVADHGYESEMKSFADFTKKIENAGIPVFNSVGNHDLYNSGWESWKEYSFPHTSFYNFKTTNFSWYSLDTGSGVVGKKQFSILKEKIQQDTHPKIIFSHYPLYSNKFLFSMNDTNERNRLADLLATNGVLLYINGHLHRLEIYELGKMTQYTLPSFRFKRKWALLQINEESKDFNMSILP